MSVTLPRGATPTSRIGFGCAYLASGLEMARSRRILDAAFDGGVRHFDLAPSYGMGNAEDAFGSAMAHRRGAVTIASKVGIARPHIPTYIKALRAIAGPMRRLAPVAARQVGAGLGQGYRTRPQFQTLVVQSSLEDSLRRLKTDHLDLLLLHEAAPENVTDELLVWLDKMRASGNVRAVGVASSPENTAAILSAHSGFFDVAQYSWSVLDGAEADSLPGGRFAITHRALVRAYGPLRDWLTQRPAALARLSEKTGADLASRDGLARALVGAALSHNPGGVVLAASHRPERARAFGAWSSDPDVLSAGRQLVEGLGAEADAPGAAS